MSSPPLPLFFLLYMILSFLSNKLGRIFVYFNDEFHIVFVCVSDVLLHVIISWMTNSMMFSSNTLYFVYNFKFLG